MLHHSVAYVMGPVLVLLGFALVVFLATIGYLYIIPTQCHSTKTKYLATAYLTTGLINILLRYVYAVMTNPGTSTSLAYRKMLEFKRSHPLPQSQPNEAELRNGPPSLLSWTICKHSKLDKPPRAHFDS